jgi:hypothetical protein
MMFAQWLAGTRGSIALHESLYMYSVIESAHVLTLCLFVGTAVMLDLRLLGWTLREIPASEVARRLLPWTKAGFVIMLVTGALLFYAIPVRTYQNIFFRIKVILLLLAGVNVWVFHRRVEPTIGEWDLNRAPPRAARVAALVSLLLWAAVIVAGRMIAYNWFDCDIQPQPAFINWAAGCL